MLCFRDSHSVTLWTPAKLNLFLEVLGRRPDGYHDLETLMVAVSLYDTLRLTLRPDGQTTLRCSDASDAAAGPLDGFETIPADDRNLVLRAVRQLREATETTLGVDCELTKRIPAAAGLGGGSSDAAAALVGLNALWKLGLSPDELLEHAARLGSDVPFFLCPTGSALCRGRGERIKPLALRRPLHFVIVRPPAGLATADVFRACRPSDVPLSAAPLVRALEDGGAGAVAERLFNRLAAPAESLHPKLSQLSREFARLPFLGHALTGSGSSYFGICAHARQAAALAARLRSARLGRVHCVATSP